MKPVIATFLSIKSLALAVFLFLLLYAEPLIISGVKVSHLWKIIVIYLLGISLLMRSRFNSTRYWSYELPRSLKFCYFFALWPLAAGIMHDQGFEDIMISTQRLFPVFGIHYLLLRRSSQQEIVGVATWFTWFITISTIPFVLHLLEPLGKGYDLVRLLGASSQGFVGIFQNPHAASLTITLILLILTCSCITANTSNRNWIELAALVYLAYILLQTYVRSGYIAFVIGCIVFVYSNFSGKKLIVFILLGVISIGALSIKILESDVIMNRLSGKSVYTQDTSLSIDLVSSGRSVIWVTALDIYQEASPLEWLVGIGLEKLKSEMGKRLDMAVFSHNGFINELVTNGIIGFTLLIVFLKKFLEDILKIEEHYVRNLALAIYFAWITFTLMQGGEFPLQQFMLYLLMIYPFSHNDNDMKCPNGSLS